MALLKPFYNCYKGLFGSHELKLIFRKCFPFHYLITFQFLSISGNQTGPSQTFVIRVTMLKKISCVSQKFCATYSGLLFSDEKKRPVWIYRNHTCNLRLHSATCFGTLAYCRLHDMTNPANAHAASFLVWSKERNLKKIITT